MVSPYLHPLHSSFHHKFYGFLYWHFHPLHQVKSEQNKTNPHIYRSPHPQQQTNKNKDQKCPETSFFLSPNTPLLFWVNASFRKFFWVIVVLANLLLTLSHLLSWRQCQILLTYFLCCSMYVCLSQLNCHFWIDRYRLSISPSMSWYKASARYAFGVHRLSVLSIFKKTGSLDRLWHRVLL